MFKFGMCFLATKVLNIADVMSIRGTRLGSGREPTVSGPRE